MNNQDLYVLISTIDERISDLKNILQPYQENIIYIVSHQVNKKLCDEANTFRKALIQRKDVRYSELEGKGVARNRNNTLKFIERSAICLILDDDIILCDDIFETVLKSFEENSSADFISFKILNMQGKDYKPYQKKKQWHSLRTLTGIGTTEIAFRSDLVLDNNISFDNRFGPGSELYPIGEDFIFAMDLYKLKAKMLFMPISIGQHPEGSTGNMLDEKIIFGRGAMFARVFGWKAYLVDFVFSVKKHSAYVNEMTFLSYLTLLMKGTIDYFETSKRRKI